MIVDTMNKLEVYMALNADYIQEIIPYIKNRQTKWAALIRTKSLREKRNISLPIIDITSSNHIKFHILIKGYNTFYDYDVTAEFDWNGKKCYAIFLKYNNIEVFTHHSLNRYAERVLKKQLSHKDILYKYIYRGVNMGYSIVLPSKTHEYTQYSLISEGLFLGNGQDRKKVPNTLDGSWYNTCISFDEAGISQMMMMTCMKQMYDSAQVLGYVPLDSRERCVDELVKGTTRERFEHIKRSIFIEYLFAKVQQSLNLPYIPENYYEDLDISVNDFCLGANISEKELKKFTNDRFEIIRREILFIDIPDNSE